MFIKSVQNLSSIHVFKLLWRQNSIKSKWFKHILISETQLCQLSHFWLEAWPEKTSGLHFHLEKGICFSTCFSVNSVSSKPNLNNFIILHSCVLYVEFTLL